MQSDRKRLKVPVFGWVGGGLVVVSIVMLALPGSKQKRFDEAKNRLRQAEVAAKGVAEPYLAKKFRVFEVPHSKEGGTKLVVWNPKSGKATRDWMLKMPDLKTLSTQKQVPIIEWEVPTAGVIFAPDPKSTAYTDLAVLSLLWEKDKSKWEWLEMLRHELNATATQPGAAARLKRNIAEADPAAVMEARKQVAENVALCKGLELGDAMYLIDGELYVANSGNDYMMKQDYELVHPKPGQPPN